MEPKLRRAITEECQQPLPEVSMQRLQDLLEQVCRLEVSEPADCSGLPRSPFSNDAKSTLEPGHVGVFRFPLVSLGSRPVPLCTIT